MSVHTHTHSHTWICFIKQSWPYPCTCSFWVAVLELLGNPCDGDVNFSTLFGQWNRCCLKLQRHLTTFWVPLMNNNFSQPALKKNLTKHTKEKDQWGIHQSFPSEMFFRDREEVKLKTFDLSQETGLHCIYCFSNSTGHPVVSHHGKGSKCISRRWALGDTVFG